LIGTDTIPARIVPRKVVRYSAIGREDGHAVTALQAARAQPARDGGRRAIEVVEAPLARRGRLAQIDQRDPVGLGRPGHHVAQVAGAHHRAGAGRSVVVL
jgi:hypothetical protein